MRITPEYVGTAAANVLRSSPAKARTTPSCRGSTAAFPASCCRRSFCCARLSGAATDRGARRLRRSVRKTPHIARPSPTIYSEALAIDCPVDASGRRASAAPPLAEATPATAAPLPSRMTTPMRSEAHSTRRRLAARGTSLPAARCAAASHRASDSVDSSITHGAYPT